jgi:hypothetical protein
MLVKAKSVVLEDLLDLANFSVQAAAQDGGMISVDVRARRLLDAYIDCPIPFEELRDAIARLALERGVGVKFRDRSYRQQHAIGGPSEGSSQRPR